jgi:hypothetical protein
LRDRRADSPRSLRVRGCATDRLAVRTQSLPIADMRNVLQRVREAESADRESGRSGKVSPGELSKAYDGQGIVGSSQAISSSGGSPSRSQAPSG